MTQLNINNDKIFVLNEIDNSTNSKSGATTSEAATYTPNMHRREKIPDENGQTMNENDEYRKLKTRQKNSYDTSAQLQPANTQQLFLQHITTAAQALLLLFVVLIIYLCFSGEFVLFTWHPLLLSVGWMFLSSEALLLFSKTNIFTGSLKKYHQNRLHWIFQTIAAVLITIGFVIVVLNKYLANKNHFVSWHAIFGLIAFCGFIPSCLNGILALYHKEIKDYIGPRKSKIIHIASGVITFVFGGLSLTLSVYTKWFGKRTNENYMIFIVGLVLVSTSLLWTMVKPTIGLLNRLRS